MNRQEKDILNAILSEPFINQRILSELSGHSLGIVNRSLKELAKDGYIDDAVRPTLKAVTEGKQKRPLFWRQVLACEWFRSTQKFQRGCLK